MTTEPIDSCILNKSYYNSNGASVLPVFLICSGRRYQGEGKGVVVGVPDPLAKERTIDTPVGQEACDNVTCTHVPSKSRINAFLALLMVNIHLSSYSSLLGLRDKMSRSM